jgi:hypothetical protein
MQTGGGVVGWRDASMCRALLRVDDELLRAGVCSTAAAADAFSPPTLSGFFSAYISK